MERLFRVESQAEVDGERNGGGSDGGDGDGGGGGLLLLGWLRDVEKKEKKRKERKTKSVRTTSVNKGGMSRLCSSHRAYPDSKIDR